MDRAPYQTKRLLLDLSALPLIVVMSSCFGCGAAPATVSGQVKFDGEPIPEGVVRFSPIAPTASPGAAATIENGAYQVGDDNALVEGRYHVAVMATRKTGRKSRSIEPNYTEGDGSDLDAKAGWTEQVVQYIPPRYNRVTELKAELTPGKNEYNLELTE